MRLVFISVVIVMIGFGRGQAAEFVSPRDHCGAREYAVTHPRSDSSGVLFGTSAWAEAGLCLRFPIETLLKAAGNIDVMTFPGTTRVVDVVPLPLQSPGQLFHLRIDEEARHEHLFICQGAQWPMEWVATVLRGSTASPDLVAITAERIAGGDSNGGYIKHWSVRIELQRASAAETSFHMRYEIAAPGQDSNWAVDAITGYVDRLITVAAGRKAPGAKIDPDCPEQRQG